MSAFTDWLIPALAFVTMLGLIANGVRSLERQSGGTAWAGWSWAWLVLLLTIWAVGAASLVALSAA